MKNHIYSGMRFMLLVLFTLSVFLLPSCGNDSDKGAEDDLTNIQTAKSVVKMSDVDLNDIIEDGILKAITIYSATGYFLYRGQAMGYEHDMLVQLADYLDLTLEIVVASDLKEMTEMLNRGDGDIIAHGLTIMNHRKEEMAFTDFLYLTKQVLVQRKPSNWRKMKLHEIDKTLILDAIDLIDDTVSVRPTSSYYARLKHLEDEMGGNIHIDTSHADESTEKLIEMVVDGDIKYTVSDKNIADMNASYHDVLHIETPLSFSQRIAWATRTNSTHLLDTVNYWIQKMKKKNDYYVIYDKYFENKKSFKKRVKSDYYAANTGKISKYDDLIKEHSKNIAWDWRFVSAIVYQESQFNPGANSWAHAKGLMQIMPGTARDLGVKDIHDPNQNLRGGTKYLKQIWDQWDMIPDSVQRLKFTLASYNCGYYHVQDAKNLAEKYKLDPLIWDDNVETYVLNLSYSKYYRDPIVKYGYARGREPVNYVKEIFERYDEYVQFVEE